MNSVTNTDSSYHFAFQELDGKERDFFLSGLKTVDDAIYYQAQLLKKRNIKAEVQVALYPDGRAVSIPKAPFGGFWVYTEVNSEVIVSFLNAWIIFLKEKGAKEIILTQAPCVYMPYTDRVEYFLQKRGFELLHILNHQFYEGKKRMKSELKLLLSKYSRKVKTENLKVSIGKIQNFNFLNEIRLWNQARGYQITFDENQLLAQVSTFPERYFVISVMQEDTCIGHALAVKLTSNSLYYFLSAIDPATKIKLAGELIMVNLLKLAVEQKVAFLDLGSSEVKGEANHSLIYFKSKFSNSSRNKITWRLKF
ncbi:hypothetical protein [Mongoliibacter sp.]|uniref:hypothetical protein n=1 Tax=Mongoliibacter sp. TaxID=2022438 RepID=UPI0025EDE46B|nr:hypothetical protein [Mongoliibacter sp.]